MILTCPSCDTRFVVNDALFGARPRRVRCSKCRHEWTAQPPETLMPPPLDVVAPISEPRPIPKGSNLPAPPAEPGVGRARLIRVAIVLAILVVGGWLLMRATFSTYIAPVAQVASTLALGDVQTRYEETAGGSYVLIVEGTIRNTGRHAASIPPVNVIVKGDGGKILTQAIAEVQRPTVEAGALTSFVHTVDPVPDGMAEVTVEFAAKIEE